MSFERQIATLQMQHQQLEGILATEMTRPRPDASRVRATKLQKLRVKDTLARLQGSRAV